MLSPDDVVRAGLVHKADKYFWGLIWSTFVLFIGAIGEYWEPLERLPTHDVNTRTRTRTPRKWTIRSQTEWKRFAVIFVVLGIAGEGFFEYFGAIAETAVRNFDNGIAVRAEKDASDADASAIEAAAKAKQAEDSAGAADKLAGTAQNKADAANTVSGKAIGEADAASQKAVVASAQADEVAVDLRTANAERTELEKSLTPRTFTSVSQADLDKLKSFKGTKIALRFLPDAEADRAAGNLMGLFKSVGW